MGTPVSYIFQPKGEEVITFLNKKTLDPDFSVQTINESFDLHRLAVIQSDEFVRYFFCAPYYKYASSKRANRRTNNGFWKVTGKGCKIFARRSKDVIGSRLFFAFCKYGDACKKHNAEWVMPEFRSQYNPPNKVETQQLPGHLHMTYDFRNHVAENKCLRVEPQQAHVPSRNHVAEKTVQGGGHADMTSSCRNHVAENVFSMHKSQLQPNQCLASNSGNHVAENIFPEVEYQLPSQYLTYNYRNHVAEIFFPRDESQLPPSHHLASHPINHVAENTCPWADSQKLPSPHFISDFRDQVVEHSLSGVESWLLGQFDALNLCNGLNYNTLPAHQSPINAENVELAGYNGQDRHSFFALQSPTYPVQRSSSYSDGSTDFNVMNFQLDSKQEDRNSRLAFQDKYPPEETGQTLLDSTHQNQ